MVRHNDSSYQTDSKASQVEECLIYVHSKFGDDRSMTSGDNDSFFAEGPVTKGENTTSANLVEVQIFFEIFPKFFLMLVMGSKGDFKSTKIFPVG